MGINGVCKDTILTRIGARASGDTPEACLAARHSTYKKARRMGSTGGNAGAAAPNSARQSLAVRPQSLLLSSHTGGLVYEVPKRPGSKGFLGRFSLMGSGNGSYSFQNGLRKSGGYGDAK